MDLLKEDAMNAILNTYRLVRKNSGIIYILILIESLLTAISSPFIIYFTKASIDAIVKYVEGDVNLFPIIMLVCLFAWREISKFIRNILDIKLEQRLEINLNKNLMQKMNDISIESIESSEFQDRLNKIKERPHMALIELFNSSIAIVSIVVKVIGIMLVFINIWVVLGICYIVAAIFDVYFSFKTVNKMNKMFENTSHNEREMENIIRILKDKNAIYEIKVFEMKNLFLNKFKKYSNLVFDERLKTTIESQNYLAMSSCVSILWMASVIVFVIVKLLSNAISVGSLAAVITSASSTLDMAEDFVYEASTVSNSGYVADSLMYVLGYDERKVEPQNIFGDEIVFDDVSFKYPRTDNFVLKDLSFKIDKNKITAIVGENGAGKSTIIKLICGMYDVNSGEVKISGAKPFLMANCDLSKEISVVFQDFVNYELSIADNILMGRDGDVSDELKLMELNYDPSTNLGKLEDDGVYLSGGENQKLAIARAIAKNSEFLIFDEPTASMDPMIEAKMYDNIIKILKSRGAIIITHRLVLSKLADDVIVLDGGKIIERGNHEQLMNKKGKYFEMYNEQSSWYKEDKNA